MKQLTDEQINRALAEWDGYIKHEPRDLKYMWGDPPRGFRKGVSEWTNPDGNDVLESWLPNYLSGHTALGLLHDLWHKLDSKQKRFTFHEHLRRQVISSGGHANSTQGDIDCCCENATAHQRALALLQTIKPELFQP